jgi:Ca2+ transporting ATPase
MLSRAWTYTPQDALAFYDTHPENGLSEQQVKRNRELYGENCMFLLLSPTELS